MSNSSFDDFDEALPLPKFGVGEDAAAADDFSSPYPDNSSSLSEQITNDDEIVQSLSGTLARKPVIKFPSRYFA
jgi:hypothetical protein